MRAMISAYRARRRDPISRPASSSTSRFARRRDLDVAVSEPRIPSRSAAARPVATAPTARRRFLDAVVSPKLAGTARERRTAIAADRDRGLAASPCRCCCCCGRAPAPRLPASSPRASARIAGQSKSMSGCCSSIVRIASSSSGERPSTMPGAVRYQYKQARPIARAIGMHEKRVFKPATIAGQSEERH